MRRRDRGRTGWRACAGLVALSCALGCATTPPSHQRFHSVETRHFSITSSLGADATRELASDLEALLVGIEFVLGVKRRTEPPAERALVYAFDDRSTTRPFALHGRSAYFLAAGRGPVLVLRTGEGLRSGDARNELLHEYAHQVLRSRWPVRPPLWYEEGLSQLASTVVLREGVAAVGLPRVDHVRRLRDWRFGSLDPVLSGLGLVGASRPVREQFDAECWLLAHYLKLGDVERDPPPLVEIAQRVLVGDDPARAARDVLAPLDELVDELNEYVRGKSLPWLGVRPQGTPRPASFTPDSLPRAESRRRLGSLALDLARPELAAEYFRASLVDAPDSVRTHAGFGEAAQREGRLEEAMRHHERALALAPEDAVVLRAAAATDLSRARKSEAGPARDALIDDARRRLEASLARDEQAETHALWSESALLADDALDAGLRHASRARELRPASLAFQLLEARLQAASGRTEPARRSAEDVAARTHAPELAAQAVALLGSLPPPTARAGSGD